MSSEYGRMCRGKTRYWTVERAEYARSRVYQSGRVRESLNIYRCPYCCDWHLGHGTSIQDEEYAEECRDRRRSRPQTNPPEIDQQ